MKCPCKECISYAICVNSKSVTLILDKCELILNYMEDWNTVVETIKILKPCWYRKSPKDLYVEATHLLDRVMSAKLTIIKTGKCAK
jgi:hypothetical protein